MRVAIYIVTATYHAETAFGDPVGLQRKFAVVATDSADAIARTRQIRSDEIAIYETCLKNGRVTFSADSIAHDLVEISKEDR